MVVKPGFLMSCRQEERTSAQMLAMTSNTPILATHSLVEAGLPKRIKASRRACSGVMPAAMLSSVRIINVRLDFRVNLAFYFDPGKQISNASKQCHTMLTSRVPQDGANAFDQVLEILLHGLQLLSAGRAELVILRFASRFCLRPGGTDPAVLLHAMKSRVKRSLLHTQQFIRRPLNMQRNAVAVKLAPLRKSLQDEKILGPYKSFLAILNP